MLHIIEKKRYSNHYNNIVIYSPSSFGVRRLYPLLYTLVTFPFGSNDPKRWHNKSHGSHKPCVRRIFSITSSLYFLHFFIPLPLLLLLLPDKSSDGFPFDFYGHSNAHLNRGLDTHLRVAVYLTPCYLAWNRRRIGYNMGFTGRE